LALVALAMLRKLTALAALGLLTAAAAPAAKAPTPKAPAAKAPAAKAAPAPAFDARDPAGLIAVLTGAGANARLGQRVEDMVPVTVTSTAANFSALFAGCNAQGKACQAVVYEFGPVTATPSLQQLNGFNQSSAMCRAFQDKAGRAYVRYSHLLVADVTRDQLITQMVAWQSCIADFAAFAKDPVGYLASAP
jgi:hypothetical protein